MNSRCTAGGIADSRCAVNVNEIENSDRSIKAFAALLSLAKLLVQFQVIPTPTALKTAINKSLSALGDVISARALKQNHVPFRNSTLTYFLQTCLSGDAKTLMLLQVSPADMGETACSLAFGARVNKVDNLK